MQELDILSYTMKFFDHKTILSEGMNQIFLEFFLEIINGFLSKKNMFFIFFSIFFCKFLYLNFGRLPSKSNTFKRFNVDWNLQSIISFVVFVCFLSAWSVSVCDLNPDSSIVPFCCPKGCSYRLYLYTLQVKEACWAVGLLS